MEGAVTEVEAMAEVVMTVPEIPEPVMEMISYSLTTLVLLRGAQARETFEHGRTEDLDRG
jgi:hypothetical protein